MTTGDPMLSFSGGAAMAGETEETTRARMQPNNTPSLNRKRLCFMSVLESASVTGREARGNRAFDLGNSRRMGETSSSRLRGFVRQRLDERAPPFALLRFATHDLISGFLGIPGV